MGLGSIIGGTGLGGALLGSATGLLDYNAQKRVNAQNQRNYENQYGTMMADLERSGLNPILAAKLGPRGVLPTITNPVSSATASFRNSSGSLLDSARIGETSASAKRMAADEKRLNEETRRLKVDIELLGEKNLTIVTGKQ